MCPNEIDTSDESYTISIGIIVGSSIASLCVICCCGWLFYKRYVSSSKSDDALYQIHVTKIATHNRIRRLEKDAETAENNALSYQKKKMTKVALVHMRRRKAALEEIERCTAILENLTAGELRLERAKGDVQLVKIYNQLKEALRDVRKSSGMENEDVEELVSDVCEEMELANSDALTEAIYNSDAIDEDELYEELRMLELECENKNPSPRKSEVNADEQVDFPSSEEVVNAPTESPADEIGTDDFAVTVGEGESLSAPDMMEDSKSHIKPTSRLFKENSTDRIHNFKTEQATLFDQKADSDRNLLGLGAPLPQAASTKSSSTNTSSSSTARKPSKKKKSKRIIDEGVVCVPTDDDVLFGRGDFANKHPGNIRFRETVLELRRVYERSPSNEEKDEISKILVESVTSEGGRFLEKGKDGKWHPVIDNGARKKASQALRERIKDQGQPPY